MSIQPYYDRYGVTVHHGDCLDVLAGLPDASVHAVVTDPPYGIGFMGHQWDQPGEYGPLRGNGTPGVHRRRPDGELERISQGAMEAGRYDLSASANQRFQVWCTAWVTECLRVLKPGGHLVSFGGSRTWHRLAAAVEDAGAEVRDSVAWLYATGFPKSLNVARAIDNAAGLTVDDPVSPEAAPWQGFGTALKPGFEPIVVARKPLEGTVAGNVLKHDTGGLNIDGCRVDSTSAPVQNRGERRRFKPGAQIAREGGADGWTAGGDETVSNPPNAAGRWPTNVILTHAATPDGVDLCVDGCVPGCVVAELDKQNGITVSKAANRGERHGAVYGNGAGPTGPDTVRGHDDAGGASRFFPVFRFEAKAPAAERPRVDGVAHPTVKPLALMRWLVRLVTPPGGVVLDPFLGSGTTAQAARAEGFQCVGIEREDSYLPLIRSRLDGDGLDLFGGDAA